MIVITTHDRHLQTARLNNELGGLYAFEFDGTQAQQCFRWAIESAKQLDRSSVAGQTELARAHLSLGDQPPNLRGNQPYAAEQRTRDLNEVNQAIEVLDRLRDSSANKTLNILYARSLLARSRLLDSPPAKRRDFSDAVTMLREQLIATPDDSSIRFEFVRPLANVDLRNRSPNRMADAVERLEQALQELQPLRISAPDNAVVRAAEVHLLHKLASIARAQSRFSDASELLIEAIRLQTALTTAWPDNVNHRCWRAMLYRSQALLYRESGNAEAADLAVASAISDVDSIDAKYAEYPMVIQTRDTIQELSSSNTKDK